MANPNKHYDVSLQRYLGSGTYGVVYKVKVDGCSRVLKLFRSDDFKYGFDSELRAYRKAFKVLNLRNRIPAFYEVVDIRATLPQVYARDYYESGLCLEYIRGKELHTVIDHYSAPDRRRLRDSLRATLRFLHDEAGVCHEDVKEQNVLIVGDFECRLLDFSNATFRKHMTLQRWIRHTREDVGDLDEIFLRADAREATRLAQSLLKTSDPSTLNTDHCQSQLANFLNASWHEPCEWFVSSLHKAITSPNLRLATALLRIYRRMGKSGPAITFAEQYLSSALPHLGPLTDANDDRRLLLLFKQTLAMCYMDYHSAQAITLLQELTRPFEDEYGQLGVRTLELKWELIHALLVRPGNDEAIRECIRVLRDIDEAQMHHPRGPAAAQVVAVGDTAEIRDQHANPNTEIETSTQERDTVKVFEKYKYALRQFLRSYCVRLKDDGLKREAEALITTHY